MLELNKGQAYLESSRRRLQGGEACAERMKTMVGSGLASFYRPCFDVMPCFDVCPRAADRASGDAVYALLCACVRVPLDGLVVPGRDWSPSG